MSLLEVRNLSKTYRIGRGRTATTLAAVSDVSFDLDRGKTLAIVGESGAGKTTVGRLVLHLETPDSGQIELDGQDLVGLGPAEMRAQRKNMQVVLQDPYRSFDPRIPIGRSVAEPLKVLGVLKDDSERMQTAQSVLERVGLGAHFMRRYPRELSGGQLQRVSIARALAVNPKLVILDEAVASLDVSIRAQVLNLLLDLQDELGVSYLFISHDLNVVRFFADDVVVMRRGSIVESGPTAQLFAEPADDYTRKLLAAIPTLGRKQVQSAAEKGSAPATAATTT